MPLHPLWTDFPLLVPELQRVSRLIRETAEQSPEPIRKDLSRLLLSSGKMLRPAFVVLASSWGDRNCDGLHTIAASVELLHIASLVHDDILDDAPRRRGVETLHRTMGLKKAVLTGDYLLGISLKMAAGQYDEDLMPVLTDSLNSICLSEMDQDFSLSEMAISRETYLKRIRGKTAELFGLSCFAGAVSSRCDPENRDLLYELGILFGMAFQIEDDILDYTGDQGVLGKSTGKDLRAGIPTLPFIEALEDRDPLAEAYLRSPIARLRPGRLQKRILRKGYAVKAEETARHYRQQAMELLDRLPETEASPVFRELLTRLQSRNS